MGRLSTKVGVLRGLAIVLFLLAIALAQAIVLVQMVERDYSGNHVATDRFWFYKNLDGTPQVPENDDGSLPGGGVYNPLEMKTDRGFQITRVVYTRGSNLIVRLRLENFYINDIEAILKFSEVRLVVPPDLPQRPNETYIALTPPDDQTVTIPSRETIDVTVTISGVPNFVMLGDIECRVVLEAVSGYTPGENVFVPGPVDWWHWERLYLTDATPKDLQQEAWTDLLEYGCQWAFEKKEIAPVAKAVTEGMFNAGEWNYNPFENHFWEEESSTDPNVTYWLTDVLRFSANVMDCRDVSGFIMLSIMALGHPATARRSIIDDPVNFQFMTNKLCRMGEVASDPDNYNHEFFFYHQKAHINGGVHDAAAAHLVDLSGTEFLNVPAGSGWSPPGYWQTPDGSGGFYGLVYGHYPDSQKPPYAPPQQVVEKSWERKIKYIR